MEMRILTNTCTCNIYCWLIRTLFLKFFPAKLQLCFQRQILSLVFSTAYLGSFNVPPTHTLDNLRTLTHTFKFVAFRPWSTDERLNMRTDNSAVIMAGLQGTAFWDWEARLFNYSGEWRNKSFLLAWETITRSYHVTRLLKNMRASLTWQSKSWKFRPFCAKMKKRIEN